nr:hypothetical transcript [Hymenolepis microstoma]
MSNKTNPMWCFGIQISGTSKDSQSALNKPDENEPNAWNRVTDFRKDVFRNQSQLSRETLDAYQNLLMELREAQRALYQIPVDLEQCPMFASDDETDES